MKNIKFFFIVSFLLLGMLNSCEDDSIKTNPIAMYGFAVDGFKVSFNNFSGHFNEYFWDFGDGNTSQAIAPSHVYDAKGEYVVTLTASSDNFTDVFSDTVKVTGPTIKIDGNFSDWDYIAYASKNEESVIGTLRGVKAFTSATHLFFYLEGTLEMKLDPFQIFFDTDNDPATGFNAADWYPQGSGFDYMYQGMYDWWGDFSKHDGSPSDWSFSWVCNYDTFFDEYNIQTFDDKRIIEFSIKKDTFGPLQSVINFGFREINTSWVMIGSIPLIETEQSKLIPLTLTE